jgi:exosome complex exonuclease RRP6
MLEYARSDTHFLLYIYDELRNTLLDRAKGNDDLIRTVLEKSEETALRTYHKEGYDFDTGLGKNGWFNVLQKWNSNLSEMQSAVFKAVHKWRDATAREDDESPR